VVGGDPSGEKRAWIPASTGMTERELGGGKENEE